MLNVYTQSLGVDNSNRPDSFFLLSVTIRLPLLRVIAGLGAVSKQPLRADHELNRDYGSPAMLFVQFAHF
jgi:hypothetical protein